MARRALETEYIYLMRVADYLDGKTTLEGYGITDAKIENGVITLGDKTITPLTQHQSLANYLTISSAAATYLPFAGGTLKGKLGINTTSSDDVTSADASNVLNILTGNNDRYIAFSYTKAVTAGASWRLGYQGTGTGDANYFALQSGTNSEAATTWNNVVRFGMNTYDATFFGKIIKNGGTASQFLKADGSVDSNTYATTAQLTNGSVTKLGTATVGESNRPIYLNAGTPTACNPGEAFLSWGGKNIAGSYAPIDAAMVDELGPNRFAFLRAEGVDFLYSRDGGETWTSFEASTAGKRGFFARSGIASYRIGNTGATEQTDMIANPKNYLLRIVIRTSAAGIYTTINKLIFYVTTAGSGGCWVSLDVRTEANRTNNVDTWVNRLNKMTITGWSAYNVANITGTTTYGNTPASHYGEWRFTFGCDTYSPGTKADGSYNAYYGLTINSIFGYGGVGWTTPSNLAKYGHLYSYDGSQNATFPAAITASQFNGLLNGNAIVTYIHTANNEIRESNGNRLSVGSYNQTTAKGFNVGNLLVSNLWADYTKVPTNGIYSKGSIVSENSVTATSFIKSGGTDSQVLLANGSVVSKTINIAGSNVSLGGTLSAATLASAFQGTAAVYEAKLATEAVALRTPRKLWGNDFDGSADVIGAIELRGKGAKIIESLTGTSSSGYAGGIHGYGSRNTADFVAGVGFYWAKTASNTAIDATIQNVYMGVGTTPWSNHSLRLTATAANLDLPLTSTSTIQATQFKVAGGTANQFMKANGTLDSTAYLPLTGGNITGSVSINANLTIQGVNTLRIGEATLAWDGVHQCLRVDKSFYSDIQIAAGVAGDSPVPGGSGDGSIRHIPCTQEQYDALVEANQIDPFAYYFIEEEE